MNLSNDKEVIVYKNEYGKYSVMLKNKHSDGTFENAYIPIQFNKGVELDNRTPIKLKNAWLSFYKIEKDGQKETKYIIRCSDFEIVEHKEQPKEEKNPFEEFGKSIETESKIGEQLQIQEDDLPF